MVFLAKNSRGTIQEHFYGAIDDLKIFNYPLSEMEVAKYYFDITGKSVCIESSRPSAMYDLNNDCAVNLLDYAEFAKAWMQSGIYTSQD